LSKQVDFIDSVPLALVAQVANRSAITPVRAKALLAEAGYPNGFSFSFSACGGAAFPDMQLASELIA
jgi:hypothetical protein